MRYVMRIAEFSESSNLWTQIALSGYPWEHTSLTIGLNPVSYLFGGDKHWALGWPSGGTIALNTIILLIEWSLQVDFASVKKIYKSHPMVLFEGVVS